jgi:hypothetical protein
VTVKIIFGPKSNLQENTQKEKVENENENENL